MEELCNGSLFCKSKLRVWFAGTTCAKDYFLFCFSMAAYHSDDSRSLHCTFWWLENNKTLQ